MKEDIRKIAQQKAEEWLKGEYDDKTKAEVREIINSENQNELIDSFYSDLEFGTGGLRGIMGVGSNRINKYTVGKATQGFANYINKFFPNDDNSVCIGYDCRNNSDKFAEIVANIFSANGIKAYIFDALRPTPEISFAIRELGCKGGVILTASHNPKEYNGYKAYWNDGSQLIPPHDKGVIEEVNKVNVKDIKFEKDAKNIVYIGKEMDDKFLDIIKTVSFSPEAIQKADDLKIVFTPLHGTTYKMGPMALESWGFKNIFVVPEQSKPDGNFPTVESANPEETAAFKMAIDLSIEKDADIAMACDPDGDRIGVAVKDDKGKWFIMNGNQTNIIFTWYIITQKQKKGLMKGGEYTVKTIVTSELLGEIAHKNDVECYDVYTGFKWIAAKVREFGAEGYVGAGEESFGFMPGTYTRDKDAISSLTLMAEIAAWAKLNGKTIFELLKAIYAEYGFSQERMIYIVRKGVSGASEIKELMTKMRNNPPKQINKTNVVVRKDFQVLEQYNYQTDETKMLDFPTTSNVLQFFLEDGSKISVRPSGTEPKIKFYFEARAEMKSPEDFHKAERLANSKIDDIIKDFVN